MANKVLRIDNSDSSSSSSTMEVYSDVSLNSSTVAGMPTVAKDVNVQAVQNSMRNIFSWIVGERVLDPEFGNRLYMYLYEGLNEFNVEQIVAEIRNCVSKYEPRVSIIEIRNITTDDDADRNTVAIDVVYSIRGLEGRVFTYRYMTERGN